MEFCDGETAGTSLYEEVPNSHGIFRCHHLTGVLAPFNGGTTPRIYSLCGTVLDRCRPLLVAKPERVYSWLVEANISLHEVLLVPLQMKDGTSIGTLWVVAREGDGFDAEEASILNELAGLTNIALQLMRVSDDASQPG